MRERVFVASVERVVDAPREVVWALVADTNRWNRAAGRGPAKYEWKEVDGKRVHTATATELGQSLEWIEPPYEWSEGWFIGAERVFIAGPATRATMRTTLEEAPGNKTKITATSTFAGTSFLTALVGPIVRSGMKSGLIRYHAAIEQALARGVKTEGRTNDPAVVRARRSLMQGYDPIVSGPRTPSNEVELTHRGEKLLRDTVVNAEVAKRLVAFLRDRPDEDLAQIRPFELAQAWDASRPDVLRAFLHATRSGLVDLRWQVNCPVCRVSAQVAGTLADVRSAVHCAACNIDYGVDFGSQVEAVFQASPAIREVVPSVFCLSGPAMRPHVLAQVTVKPGETREIKSTATTGDVHARTLESRVMADVVLGGSGGLVIELSDDGLAMREDTAQSGIVIVSHAKDPQTVLVERAGWHADAVLGSIIASFPDFHDLFATEAPATGVELAIGHLAVLFSDLTGSTALYEKTGDARAFAIVEEHFRAMEKSVVEHGGAVVKTMGDAVMATFPHTEAAIRAAIDMIAANETLHAPLGLGVKIGVHAGACLAVRANERLDFFGTTVNVAARLQAQAKSAELVVTEETAAHPAVAALLAGRASRRFDASLKGIAAMQKLIGFDLKPAEAEKKKSADAAAE